MFLLPCSTHMKWSSAVLRARMFEIHQKKGSFERTSIPRKNAKQLEKLWVTPGHK